MRVTGPLLRSLYLPVFGPWLESSPMRQGQNHFAELKAVGCGASERQEVYRAAGQTTHFAVAVRSTITWNGRQIMRMGLLRACFALATLISSVASAVELNYTWRKGDIHHYSFEETSKLDSPELSGVVKIRVLFTDCLLYTSPSPRD